MFETSNYLEIVRIVEDMISSQEVSNLYLNSFVLMAITHSFFECKKFPEAIKFGKEYLVTYSLNGRSMDGNHELDIVLLDIALSYEHLEKPIPQYLYLSKYIELGKPQLKVVDAFRNLERRMVEMLKRIFILFVFAFFSLVFFTKPAFKDTTYYTILVVLFFLFLLFNHLKEGVVNVGFRKFLHVLLRLLTGGIAKKFVK
ncbi:MAG: hypothetical protein Q8R57_10415 [Bacteroidota bacterium]|nr:hypothetical protein [Bacteroidota bacterium]